MVVAKGSPLAIIVFAEAIVTFTSRDSPSKNNPERLSCEFDDK